MKAGTLKATAPEIRGYLVTNSWRLGGTHRNGLARGPGTWVPLFVRLVALDSSLLKDMAKDYTIGTPLVKFGSQKE